MLRSATPHPSRRAALPCALLAALCMQAAAPARADDAAASGDAVTTLDRLNVKGERAKGYTVEKTSAGTRLELAPREIPQSVSVITAERIEDQNLQDIGQVLAATTGVTSIKVDSERTSFYARGFYIDNYQFDGIPVTMIGSWNFLDQTLDMALYDHVEVVRGATGLLTGAGNPSASVNLVRKHADSRTLTGSVTVSGGDYNSFRSTVDVTTPLNRSGSVRGRVIGSYTSADAQMDRYGTRKELGYAIIDADLSEKSRLSFGYSIQDRKAHDVAWSGFPTWDYATGARTTYSSSFNPSTDWTYWNTISRTAFATLDMRFDNDWTFKLNASHENTDNDDVLEYPYGSAGTTIASYSHYTGERRTDALDGFAEGPFQWFGREHHLMAGFSYNRQNRNNDGGWGSGVIDDYGTWNGYYPADLSNLTPYGNHSKTTQKAVYAAARFSLADPLSLIVGARDTRYQNDQYTYSGTARTTTYIHYKKSDEITPYAGLVYDLNDVWSVYASYTSIFQPQTGYYDANDNPLDPRTGKNYEIGAKAAWFDNRLNASLAVFRIEQDNLAVSTGLTSAVTGNTIYTSADNTVSRGFDFEISGQLAQGWNATFGVSRYVNPAASTFMPRTTAKLFTSYTPQSAPELSFGGGINWQNRTYYTNATYGTVEQSGYPLASLFARYRLSRNFTAQINIDNLFDKDYVTLYNAYSTWGNGRTGSLTFTWSF